MKSHPIFRSAWWTCNVLVAAALALSLYSALWEMSVRRYLRGFSDAIVAEAATPQQKAEAILAWMANGPSRREIGDASQLSPRDPEETLNYRALLAVCGSATNAFLNLSRSAGVPARRLLLLAPDGTSKHVVAEVNVQGRWVIVDASYRAFLEDSKGNLLTRAQLQDPALFREATGRLSNYSSNYTYERFAHVRMGRLFYGTGIRTVLDRALPRWDEYLDWTLLLERRSFCVFFFSSTAFLLLLILRSVLGWIADHRLQVPRSHLRANLVRAMAAFFRTPEMK